MFKNITVYIFVQILTLILLVIFLSSVKLKGIRLWSYLNTNIVSEGGQAKLMFNDLNNFEVSDNAFFVIGSSHAYRGYDPRVFATNNIDLFNMGTSGQNMKDSYVLIKANNTKIKNLIIDIYPGVLQQVNDESTLMLIQNANEYKTAYYIFKNNITINSINNLAARVSDLNHKSLPYSDKYVKNGYVQTDNSFTSDSSIIYDTFKPGPNFQYLDSVLSFALKNNINITLASHPIKWNTSYRNYYNYSYLPVLKKALNKYPKIKFLDYTLAHPNNDSLFSDANHLNQKGVNWYNAQLIKNLKPKQ